MWEFAKRCPGCSMLRETGSADSFRRDSTLNSVCIVLVLGFGLAFALVFLRGGYLNYGYPFNTFLFLPQATARDFIYPYAIANNPYATSLIPHFASFSNLFQLPEMIDGNLWTANSTSPLYFPYAYWIASFFRLFPVSTAYLLYPLITSGTFALLCLTRARGTHGYLQPIIIFMFSYPFLFLVDRANLEIFVLIFLAIFIYFYDRARWISVFGLACAIAMKLFPALFLLMFLRDRRYKELAVTTASAWVRSRIPLGSLERPLGVEGKK